MRPILLDHSIVGQDLTTLSIRKDREYAACRICGAIFQSSLNTNNISDMQHLADPLLSVAAHIETMEWRNTHNNQHSNAVHKSFQKSGLTLTPEAAHALAPFGIVPPADALLDEHSCALLEAPRAPVDDVENAPKRKGV